jgi:hypothetical protein
MLKNTLLLSSLLLFSGCAERGYRLTAQANTHTLTAESSVDISDTQVQTNHELQKMKDAIKKERKKKSAVRKAKNTITEIKTREKKERVAVKKLHATRLLEKELEARKAKALDKKRLALQKEEEMGRKHRLLAEEQEKKRHQEEIKKLAEFKVKKQENKAKALEASMKKSAEEQARKKEKTLEIEKALQAKAAAATLEAKKTVAKNAEILRLARIKESKIIKEEKAAKLKRLQEQKRKKAEAHIVKRKKSSLFASTQPLKFQLINKIYHKFGSSEVHGHVIYLSPTGQETRLTGSKVYLSPISAKLNNWYENYYLKNKNNPSTNNTVVNYLNSTYLNLEKNFEFYGVAEGSYYVIIESNYPPHMARNKKVYIAKKIQVGKNKKIMAVFSKKL